MSSEPKQVVVIGAGVGGLGTALALSRAGHHVTILERDATPTPADADAAFEWDRRGAPQVRHSHALLARLRNVLRDRYPDVLEHLLEVGATEIRFCDNPPEELLDREPRDGDEDLVAIACRRTTFEWVLRTMVLAEPGVELRDGVAVDGLVAGPDDPSAPGIPRIVGVRLTGNGDDTGEIVPADLVVTATGRRSGAARWLGAHDVAPRITEADTGIIYLSRFYRLHEGAAMPEQRGPVGGDLGYLKYAVFQGDNRTYSVTFAVRHGDDELRTHLIDPDGFNHAGHVLPATTAWVQADVAEAITPVHVMAGLLNRRIDYVGEDGRPLVLGFHAVGDAHTCTNPLYGRGCSLAMVQATLLADALDAHPDDLVARAIDYEEASRREVLPWYKASVAQDQQSIDQAEKDRAHAAGEELPDDGEVTPEDFMKDVIREGLFPALRTDPIVFRAFIHALNLLTAPDALTQDADVIGRVLNVYQDRDNRPPEPDMGPPRDVMLAALAGTPA